MKYAAIAALLVANTSAVDTAVNAACSTATECGTVNRCVAVT
jgi:hypothetical protein